MTTWQIPAKTFLIGEYVALNAGPAILLTTKPCFELSLVHQSKLPFHPDSPAGRFCREHQLDTRVSWYDPYRGLGGLGGSSAEFVGSFYAYCELMQCAFDRDALLDAYWTYTSFNGGARPSGYDVIAQTSAHCVMIHQAKQRIESCAWPFHEIGFVLVHTQHKLATHTHLKEVKLTERENAILFNIAKSAWAAFEHASSETLIIAVNSYYDALRSMSLVAQTTRSLIDELSEAIAPLAIKGCGALGADVVLMIVERSRIKHVNTILAQKNITILADVDSFQ